MTSQAAVQPSLSTGMAIPERILFGRSEAMQTIRARIEKVAQTQVPVLIVGESGAGKEMIARYVHNRSLWRGGPFVRINCPGIPGTLLESELSGYENGAISGTPDSRMGLVESAGEGTLFLDGICELEFSLQSKFLQFLQHSQSVRIGDKETPSAKSRIICAANHPLEADIESGRFRRDLFYRINVVSVHLPPLRERRLDIPDLIDFFLQGFSNEFGRVPRPIRAATHSLLVANDWPGNIRQLENLIKRYVLLDAEDAILADLCHCGPLAQNSSGEHHDVSLKQVTRSATRDLERKVILDALSANHWNRKKTAAALHISYRALLYKIKQGGLPARRTSATVPEDLND